MAEVVNTMDMTILDDYTENERVIVEDMLGSGVFRKFIELQVEKAKDAITELNPSLYKDMEEFYQIAKDRRLLWRFWNDLHQYTEDCATRAAANRN